MTRLPKPLLLLRPEGSRDREGRIEPTVSGGVRVVDGKYGKAWQVAEAAENLIPNPRFANNMASWTRHTSVGEWAAEDGVFTGEVGEHTNLASISTMAAPLAAGDVVSASYRVTALTSGTRARVRLLEYVGSSHIPGATQASDYVDLTPGEPVEIRHTFAPLAYENTDGIRVYLEWGGTNSQAGEKNVVEIFEPQAEVSPYVTPFVHGDMGPGFAWTGAPNASTSTRANAHLVVSARTRFDEEAGSILIRYRMEPSNSTGYLLEVGTHNAPETDWFALSDRVGYFRRGDDGPLRQTAPAHSRVYGYGLAAYVWSGDLARMRRGDTDWGEMARDPRYGAVSNAIRFRRPSLGFNGEIESIVIFGEPLTDVAIDYLMSMTRPWTWGELAGDYARISNVVRPGSPPYAVRTRLWRCDRWGRTIDEVPVDMPVQGTIVCNQDARPARKISLEINEPDRLEPFRDWIKPEITLTDAAGVSMTRPFGLYMVTPPSTRLSAARYSGTLEATDMTWRLMRATLGQGRTIAAGTDYGAAARSLILEVGFAPEQVAIPDIGIPLARPFRIDPGDTVMDAATALLNAVSWYAPWMSGAGIITTAPGQELATARPVRTFGVDADELTIVPDIDEDPNWDRLRNKITVRNIAPDRDPIYATESITNRAHPLYHEPGDDETFPVWLADTIDDPDVPDEAAARARARVLLSEGASYYRPVTVRTVIDLEADMHDVIGMNIRRHGKQYDGAWFRRAWEVELRGVTATTRSDLWRVEPWQ